MPMSDLAIWLANRRMSGQLSVERDEVCKVFDLLEGTVLRASSTDPRERFGQFLMHHGLLTDDQRVRAFQTQEETNVLLGRILVMIGIVPEEQVVQFLRVKISESLLDVFRWTTGRFTLLDDPSKEQRPEIEVRVPLVDIHREGASRMGTWEHFRRLFPDPQQELQINEDRIPPGATPDTLDGRLLSLARHGLTIQAITRDLNATDYQIAARLYELHRMGVVFPKTLEPPPGPAPRAPSKPGALAPPGAPQDMTPPSPRPPSQELEGPLPSRSAIPTLARPIAPDQQLSAKERYLLGRIDGKRTIESILQISPLHDAEALAILRSFAHQGLIKL